jgi:hypothetical protein
VALRTQRLPDARMWWRIADPAWSDPLDPAYAGRVGGRWNPPDSFPTLYLNADLVTARLNLRHFIAAWPYEPEDLRDDTGPVLVGARLPRQQWVCDVHSREGVAAVGLPASYPLDDDGTAVEHAPCQAVGLRVHGDGLRGIYARSAQARDGAGRELAWFPAGPRSRARRLRTLRFEEWFWN